MADVPHTYIIAEIGCNHQGDLERFKQMILKAKECGVDAVKSQKRNPREFLTPEQYDEPYNSPHSFAETYGLHREFLEFGREEWEEAMAFADNIGIPLFASVFDVSSAKFMNELDSEMFKIGAGQVTRYDLLEEVSSFGKPIMLSTGMSTYEEIEKALGILQSGGSEVQLMQCTSCYPCAYEDLNLRTIPTLRERFGVPVGFSGHHVSVAVDAAAVALGAVSVERHFTLDRAAKGTDQALSLEPIGMEKVVKYIRATELALGDPEKRVLECELSCRLKHRGY